jgi:hypothetical protein
MARGAWLQVPGIGGPGTISVGWYDHGPNPNDGHMAMTCRTAATLKLAAANGDFFQIGGGAAGASRPAVRPAHVPAHRVRRRPRRLSGVVVAVRGRVCGGSGTGAPPHPPAAEAPHRRPQRRGQLQPSVVDRRPGRVRTQRSRQGVGTTKSGSDLSLFGNAAGSAVSGQVDSALGVLGVNGSPGWLKAISTLVGGISIGGSGGSAEPNAATPSGTGTPPQTTRATCTAAALASSPAPRSYNITARDTEDAFVKAQRYEREKAAAKLSRF